MPAFSYIAVDAEGRTRRGVVEAEAPRQARAGLRGAGLVAVELTSVAAEAVPGGARVLGSPRRISAAELPLLTRRFAMLLEAGLTVEQCLDALIEQAEGAGTAQILAAVRAEVLAGHAFASALERYPASFPELYRALVATGEQSGALVEVMTRLADHLERRLAVRQTAGLALLYPAIVAIVALLVVVGLLAYVVPQVAQVYEQSRQGLPLLTRALLWASAAVQAALPALVAAAAGIGFLARAAWRREATRSAWQRRILRLPILGPIARSAETGRLSGTLAILLGSGVPLVHSLQAGARTLRYLPLRDAVEDAVQRVREGSTLHRALGAHGLFPPLFLHLVASGESSGRLAHTLAQAARQHEAESEMRIRLLAGVLEPAVIVTMGIIVLLIVLAILLPIIQLNQLVR